MSVSARHSPTLRNKLNPEKDRPFGVSTAVHWRGCWLLGLRGNELWRGLWSLPGGRVEDGETPSRSAARELQEETGLIVEPQVLSPFMDLDLGEGRTLGVHLWEARADELLEPEPSSDCLGISWLTLDALLAMPESAKTPRLNEVMRAAAHHLTTHL
ncbi:MAG: NUDIX domain-containing protein [Pseudomonadota bacterium]